MNETELKKLTVVQLRLMCKEKKITGYSKLGKSYIIEKLVNWQRSQAATGTDNSQLQLDVVTETSGLQPLATDASTLGPDSSLILALPVDSNPNANSGIIVASSVETQDRSMATKPSPMDKKLQHDAESLISVEASRGRGQNSSDLAKAEKMPLASGKRRLEGEESFISKNLKKTRMEPSAIVLTPAFKVPQLPERAELIVPPIQVSYSEPKRSDTSKKSELLSVSRISSLKAGPAISTSKPFKALVPLRVASKSKHTQNQLLSTECGSKISTNKGNLLVSSISADLDFSQEKLVELGPITLAPSISQRKRAPDLALILSRISIQDLAVCAQVSRLFRYSGKILLLCIPI